MTETEKLLAEIALQLKRIANELATMRRALENTR
jgi:hypothetical protein